MVVDVSNPIRPVYETYINTRIGATGRLGSRGNALSDARKISVWQALAGDR